MTGKEVRRRIEELGGWFVRQKGSHARFAATAIDEGGTEKTVFTTVPQHPGHDMAIGTLRAIQKDLEPALGRGWLL